MDYTSTGFYIAPTFGAEYYILSKLSLGLDIVFQYTLFDVKDRRTNKKTNVVTSYDRKETRFNTISMLLVLVA